MPSLSPVTSESLKPGAGVWFHNQDTTVIIPIPPPAFFDSVPDNLDYDLCAMYPFLKEYTRVLSQHYPEIIEYVESTPVPKGSLLVLLKWAVGIGVILLENGFSFLYMNQLVTKETDGAELRRVLRRLPEYVRQHWAPDEQINVLLAMGVDIEPILMTWGELLQREKPQF